jgi:hypothetical protein
LCKTQFLDASLQLFNGFFEIKKGLFHGAG